MTRLGERWQGVAGVLAGIGGIFAFVWEAVNAAHHQIPVLDEGTYLLKGLWFARGVYRPFQPYGPWTNHMPLSFLVPGYIQKWWGPGLDVGRYANIGIAVLALLGMGALVWRLAGRNWGVFALWAFVAMPAAVKIYSLAISQALAACLFLWAAVLLAEPSPRRWQLFLSGLLAGALTMTRLNMAAAWLGLGLFALWVWPRRSVWFWLPSLAVVLGMHALYWPRILWSWAHWLPSFIPWPASLAPPLQNTTSAWQPADTMLARVDAAWNAVRAFPLAWLGLGIGTLAVFAARKRTDFAYRFLVAGTLLGWVLVVMHGWASLGGGYCVDCFTTYTGFYAPFLVALGGIGLALPWKSNRRWMRLAWMISVVFFAAAAANRVADFIAASQRVFSGWTGLVNFLTRLLYWPQIHVFPSLQAMMAARVFWGLVFLVVCLVFAVAMWRLRRPRMLFAQDPKPAWMALAGALLLLSPLTLFSSGWAPYDCSEDVLAAHEYTARQLAQALPAGTRVYWDASFATLLLHTEDVLFLPQQMNGDYNFRVGGDPDGLASWGFWNKAVSKQWLRTADVVVTDAARLHHARHLWQDWGFVQAQTFSLVPTCTHERGNIIVFRRSP